MTETVLCADIGTSSLKTALVSKDGTFHAFHRERFSVQTASTQTPNQWFIALQNAAAQLQKQLASSQHEHIRISAFCISGNGPTLASDSFVHLWDAPNGTNEDNARYAAQSAHSLFLPRLLFIKEKYPIIWKKTPIIFSGPEYLIYQLSGTALTILPEARFAQAYWDNERLTSLDIENDKLPPFVFPGYCAGSITPEAAKLLSVPEDVKIYCGSPDFVAALIGTDTLTPGRLCDRAGTSEGLNLCTAEPVYADGIRTLPSVIPSLWNASVLLPDSGKRFSDFKHASQFADAGYEATTASLLHDVSSEGYALMNDIAIKVRDGIRLLEEKSGYTVKAMRITGGQARNTHWNQFKADCTGIPVEVTAAADAELTGDAVTAFFGMGEYDSLQEAAAKMVHVSHTFYPATASK